MTEEQRCLLWLSTAGIASTEIDRAVEKYGSARAVWAVFAGTGRLSQNASVNERLARMHTSAALDDQLAQYEALGATLLFRDDPAYPEALRAITDAPVLLYCMGDRSMLAKPCVAVVGTRYPTGYGRDMARSIAFGLCNAGVCVVSGLARGVDACAHEGALQANGATAAVLGSGINRPYPPENASLYRSILDRGGLIVSEYPLHAEPLAFHFPHRNRVIAGLCAATVFVEGRIKSGGMLTVGAALQQGREVYAVPGRVGEPTAEGPLQIIREGARLVTGAADVLEDLGLEAACAPETAEASGDESPALRALRREDMTLDELCIATGLHPDELTAELTMLELTGKIRREGGSRFAVCR